MFPPAPKLVVRVSTETVVDIISSGVVIGVPWHRSETVIDVISAATVSASVTVDTESVVDVVSETTQIVDVVNSETVVDIVSGTTVKPSPTVTTNTVVDIVSTSSVKPSPTINTETVVDIVSSAVVIPSPTTAGETIVDIASTSTVKPSPTVNTNTIVDIFSEGSIITSKSTAMVKGTATTTTLTSLYPLTGMVADTSAAPGSIVNGGTSLVSQHTGQARVGFCVGTTTGASNLTPAYTLYKNGVQVPGTEISDIVTYRQPHLLSGSFVMTVAAGDTISIGMTRNGNAGFDLSWPINLTRLHIVPVDMVPASATITSSYQATAGWADITGWVPTSGTTISGNSIVVPATNPAAIIAAQIKISTDVQSSIRFLVNGTVVYTGPNAPGYDFSAVGATTYPLVAGDLVKVQYLRNSAYNTLIDVASKFAIV